MYILYDFSYINKSQIQDNYKFILYKIRIFNESLKIIISKLSIW